MKPLPPKPTVFRRPTRKGVALILVLSALVLITALVIGLMARAVTERKSATSYVAVASTRQLSDTVVNTIQAQINDATTQGSAFSWASQPGALRVFNNASGNLQRIYKLYSAPAISATTVADLATDLPPTDWATKSALWTDLNAPATYATAGGTTQTAYPILDTRDILVGSGSIPGFSLPTTPPGATLAQPAPMPVRWLYVLQDGRLVCPDASTTTTATFASSSPVPTAANPIVGRVAFWTDDDSSKVNINTAADGTFWDTPHFDAGDERTRALYQPASREFQGYPGHPATTSLKAVFPTLSSQQILNLLPRYDWGGSENGTRTATAAITPKTGGALRLYSSPGELLLNYQRTSNGLTRQQLESAKFFITARSRAPEVNLFGKPRVAIWPIHANVSPNYRSITDRLIAFCSTINNDPYYFQRLDPHSTTTDITIPRNILLLNYLDSLTQENIPCIGGTNFDAKYGVERRQILTEIFDYTRIMNLRDPLLCTGSFPNLDYAFTYAGNRNNDQFGWGQVTPSRRFDWATRGFGRFPVIAEATMQMICMGEGVVGTQADKDAKQIDFNQYNYTRNAFGEPPSPDFPSIPARTVGSRTIQSFFLLSFFVPAMGFTGLELGITVRIEGLNQLTLNGLPMRMTPSGALTMVNRDSSSMWNGRGHTGVWDYRVWTSRRLYPQGWSYRRELQQNNPIEKFAFYSHFIEVPTASGQMTLASTGPLTIKIYAGNVEDADHLVQTYLMNFPSNSTGVLTPIALQIPKFGPMPRNFGTGFDDIATERTSAFWNEYKWRGQIDVDNDVLISSIPSSAWGDYRLLALADNVPNNAFVMHPFAFTTTPAPTIVYGAKDAMTRPWHDAGVGKSRGGNLIGGYNVPTYWDSIVPATIDGAYANGNNAVMGDWDNGLTEGNPGPFINKPDEGMINGGGGTPYFDGDWNDPNFGMTMSHFSPNRQIPSAVMYGSLPTGGRIAQSFQTLLFRPGPTAHIGEAAPKDHYLLDLFWMPVAEPYAISEPFSTAGKVNMNYQIQPFTYIKRSTAVQAVLMGEKVAKVPKTGPSGNARQDLNMSFTNGTMRQFDEKFAGNDIFRSASEICEIFLVPSSESWPSDATARANWYGDNFARVGDNVRERPYANIYPRLTTKSNVYTVHYIVQALKNPSTASQAQFDQSTGSVIGEYRGSTTLERYIDSNDTTIPDYATAAEYNSPNLENFYRWRIIENAQFAP